MEIKVLCDCGQKFKFDVEPVNGQMPFAINCPVCNADATTAANAVIQEQLAASPPIAPAAGGLRIHRSTPPPAPSVATSSSMADANPTPPAIGAMRPFAVQAAANPPKKTSFGMGLLGGFIGALAGSIIYLLIYKFTGLHFKLLAVGVGALAGWFADYLGKGDGSKELGGITAVLVVAGVVGAQYFVASDRWHELVQMKLKLAQSAYADSVEEAKQAVKAIPTGSDAEIRNYLAIRKSEEGDKVSPSDISDGEVKLFRKIELPEYQGLASGQITRENFNAAHQFKTSLTKEDQAKSEDTFKSVFLLILISRLNLLALAGAGALAFKLSTNA
jgi:hypothetical protein